jgi:diguanylate cyclase (GGDEF)-like protein
VISHVLRVTAQTIENSLRPTDFLGRYGDHRLLAVLPECAQDEVESTAERLKRMVALSEIRWWGDEWSITASFGGTSAMPGDTNEAILERAEAALDASLRVGNRISVSFEHAQSS